jgi:uncharacterized OB-fold protein
MSNEEEIERFKCKKCGLIQFNSHLRCLNCKNDTFDIIKSSGNCKLLSFTVLNAPPMEFRDQKSYALGIVEFNNGIKALGQISIKENLKIGMELKSIYKKICNNLDGNEIYAHVFEPLE